MTRVNLGVLPSDLCDKHLVSEYRELPRVFNRPRPKYIPHAFRLGTGHVSFCWSVQQTLWIRFCALIEEMRFRGFATSYVPFIGPLQNHGVMSEEALQRASIVVKARIVARIETMKTAPRWTRRRVPLWVTAIRS